MSTIEFDDYNVAYDQTESIYRDIEDKGQEIIKNLEQLCATIKDKWQGSDAVPHINKLNQIHESLSTYLKNSAEMVIEVSDYVIDVQDTVNQISGGVTVGEKLKDKLEAEKQEDVSDTEAYHLENLTDEYNFLDKICQDYLNFKNGYAEKFDTFFKNWKEDPRKQRIENIFDEFISKMDEYQPILEESRTALGQVVSNTDGL